MHDHLRAVKALVAGAMIALLLTTAPGVAQQKRPARASQPAGPAVRTVNVSRVMASDQELRLDFLYSLNPDCSSIGFAKVRVMKEPDHGKVTVDNGTGFTSFARDNQRFDCNKSRSDGVVIMYKPEAGYVGADSVTLDAIYPSGTEQKRNYKIEVK
jgi:hypothetical protein